jgi:SAM-dependent MidA family methyltransferase
LPASSERFDRYQERCLYDPVAGFYARGGRGSGRRSDFLTSPEVGPLFGAVLARAIDGWWDAAGRPPVWRVVECGSGPGTLGRAVAAAEPACPLDYVEVERWDPLPAAADVVVANELLDNLPVRILERIPEGWAELWVAEEARPTELAVPDALRSTERWVPNALRSTERWVAEELRSTELSLPIDAPVGTRLPVLEQAAAWVRWAQSVAPRVVCFDYGVRETAELVGRDWLRTYAAHGRGTDPFVEPGTVDITVDVPIDQLPEPTAVTRQADWLRSWGIEDLVEEGRRVWAERAHLGDLEAIRGRSRVLEAEALCDPDGLGAFWVLEWF